MADETQAGAATSLDEEAREALEFWGLASEEWRVEGTITTALEGLARPVLAIGGERYVLRRQPPDVSERDLRFRHALMRALALQGLPVPGPLVRPGGQSYAVTSQQGIYELLQYHPGAPYISGEPGDLARIESAAATLGRLHQGSAELAWDPPHLWPEVQNAANLTRAYIALISKAAESPQMPASVRAGLTRVAAETGERVEQAARALEAAPDLPELHLHGDYQPHHLAFAGDEVVAIYDFTAAHWGRRLDELAYSLLYWTGVRWDEQPGVTPPLVGEGLDVLRAHRFLAAYGVEAPPAEGEARLVGDALTLAFPVVFANGVAEDLIVPQDYAMPPDEEDALARLQWAETFWLWLERYRDMLAETWETA
jgi:aminoglycoside phosphotransferase (APT) family kinase protein